MSLLLFGVVPTVSLEIQIPLTHAVSPFLSNGFRKQGISDYTLNSLAYNEVTHGV